MQNNSENRNLGENIRLYRIKAGLTIRELSKRIAHLYKLEIRPASLRNYERGTEKIPAIALYYIAMITKTDIHAFYQPAHPTVLLDNHKIHLLEAYSMIRCQATRDSLLYLVRKLGRKAVESFRI